MKCPRCGHWNKPSFPRCFQCGEPLNANEERTPAWREQLNQPSQSPVRIIYDDATPIPEDVPEDTPIREAPKQASLASEMRELKERRARGSVYLSEFRKNAAEKGIAPSGSGVSIRRSGGFFSEVPDDPSETLQTPRREGGSRRHAVAPPPYGEDEVSGDDIAYSQDEPFYELDNQASDEYIDEYADDLPPSFDDRAPLVPRHKKAKRRRIHGPAAVAVWTVRLLVVLTVAFVVWQGVLFFQNRQPPPMAEEATEAFIEPIEIDGLPGRRIRIAGKEGSQIYISELTRSFVVVGGSATIEIADHVFYDTLPSVTASQMEIVMTPTSVTDGIETRLSPIQYTIDIPLSPLTMLAPEVTKLSVSTSVYNLSMQVQPGSRVTINGEDLTDRVNNDGIVTHNPPIRAIGDNYITITVKAPYCRENSLTLTIYREPQEIPLEYASDTLVRTSMKSPTIRASTQPGATIAIESPYTNLIEGDLATSGEFRFDAQMSKVGNNTIRIRASMPDKPDSVLEHVVYYLPPVDEYTSKAWALKPADYKDLLGNITLRMKNAQIYYCKGVIKEILSEKPQTAIMDTGTDGKEQLVHLENQSIDTWKAGEIFEVYADVSGLYNDIPRLIGRYSYPDRTASK